MNKDFGVIATQYAQDVAEGKIIANKYHRLACERHLNDLKKAESDDSAFLFNPELIDNQGKSYFPAQRICQFAELMPHIKGDWAGRGERIKLENWQIFILAVSFGWIDRKTLKRRFRQIDLYVPRKNAKSTLGAVIGLYMLALDNEFGAEIYSGATSKDQAYEVFEPARLMALDEPEYRSRYGVLANKSNLAVQDTNSKFEPVVGKPGDGASPSCALIDEYHEHKTDSLYETMETGMGARSQPIIVVITTSGENIAGPCYQHQKKLEKILEGTETNERRFGIIFTMDKDDDPFTEDALRKANPNFGISVSAEFLLDKLEQALSDPRKQAIYKTKHLNIWVASASPAFDMQKLIACGDSTLKLEDFAGEDAYIANDLASKVDLASTVVEFVREIEGEKHYYVFSKNYAPEAAVNKKENDHYRGWVEAGHLIQTNGNMISLNKIQKDTEEIAEMVNTQEIAMDMWGAREIAPNMQEEGYTVIDVPMNVKYLSEPMKDIAALIDDGRFHHDGNPVYVWCMSNVEVKPDHNENWFPRKQSLELKIDAAVANILSHGRAMLGETSEKIKKIKQGFVAL